MAALAQFQVNIAAAQNLVAMYRELRRLRGLGQRGSLNAANADLLWLPRSAVVTCLSALDAYVHAVVYDRIPHILRDPKQVPDALGEEMARILPIKNATTFRDALPILLASNTLSKLAVLLKQESLRFRSYQAPEKVESAYTLIGVANVFESVSSLWPGPRTDANHIKRRLAAYVRRRDQIAHEGDMEPGGRTRHMQPDYADACRGFVDSLVTRLDRAVYGP